jgi:hypothetical protein
VRDHPALRIYVHEKGAPHLINPDKPWVARRGCMATT